MKRLLSLILIGLPVLASPDEKLMKKGYEVFKKHCQACHIEYATPEKMREIVRIVRQGGKPPIAAPPMNEVSARVKYYFPEEDEFIDFVVDYITEPAREKGLCKPKAFELFGVMPPIGKNLSEEERKAVAYWMYHRYEDTWEEMIKLHRGEHRGRGPRHNH